MAPTRLRNRNKVQVSEIWRFSEGGQMYLVSSPGSPETRWVSRDDMPSEALAEFERQLETSDLPPVYECADEEADAPALAAGGGKGTSRLMGVTRNPKTLKWRGHFRHKGKRYAVPGEFGTEEAAARARDSAVLSMGGRRVLLNFPEEHNLAGEGGGGSSSPSTSVAPKRGGGEEQEEEQQYGVEAVAGKRVRSGSTEYYVLWEGYSKEEGTWEPEELLKGAPDAVAAFEEAEQAEGALLAPGPAEKNTWQATRLSGVSQNPRSDLFRAEYTHRGKLYRVGHFLEEADAALAREEAMLHYVGRAGAQQQLNYSPLELKQLQWQRRPGGEAGAAAGGARVVVGSSRFRGVCWQRAMGKWRVFFCDRKGRERNIGYYDDEEEAARVRDRALLKEWGAAKASGRLNFPVEQEGEVAGSVGEADRAGVAKCRAKSSRYAGVSWQRASRKWHALVYWGGRKHYVGAFDDEEEAARARDRALVTKVGAAGAAGKLNFPVEQEGEVAGVGEADRAAGGAQGEYAGVAWDEGRGLWRASMDVGGVETVVGHFHAVEAAALARDQALIAAVGARAAEQELNFRLPDEGGADEELGGGGGGGNLASNTGRPAGSQAEGTRSIDGGGGGPAAEGWPPVVALAESYGSRFTGVSLSQRYGAWQAVLTYKHKRRHLGYFRTELGAARARDRALLAAAGASAAGTGSGAAEL